jgi:lipoprotein-anchoring transpeptidase ErfK/SrfK
MAAVFMVVLSGCSTLPEAARPATSPDAATPDGPLALVSAAPSEAQRIAYRQTTGVDQPVTSLAIPLPVLPSSVPVVETRIAVMPASLPAIDVWPAPDPSTDLLATFQRHDEFDQPRVFRILDDVGAFFHVQVPMRPNGSTGYIRRSDVEVITTDQRILIDLSDRAVIVWDGADVVLDTIGTIGQQRTPTPTGSFYVRNVFEWYADSVYGPYVIPLSAYSEAIDQINGGDAVVAIHGTQRPDLMGSAASLGCVRLSNDVLRELAAIVEPGAPVEIIP